MACLFAARLAAIGVPVTMMGTWQAGLEALKEHGVTVVEGDGRGKSYPVEVISDPAPCVGTRHALVLVKSWQTQRAAHQMAVCLDHDGVVLTLQNGLGNRFNAGVRTMIFHRHSALGASYI